jgi:hypothetical protein
MRNGLLISLLEFMRISHIEHDSIFLIQEFLRHSIGEGLLLLKESFFYKLTMRLRVG